MKTWEEYAQEAEKELEAAASTYGHTHGFMNKDQRDSQIVRAQYHASRAVALTNLAILLQKKDLNEIQNESSSGGEYEIFS